MSHKNFIENEDRHLRAGKNCSFSNEDFKAAWFGFPSFNKIFFILSNTSPVLCASLNCEISDQAADEAEGSCLSPEEQKVQWGFLQGFCLFVVYYYTVINSPV